jgi:hypothetical protein
MILYLPGNILKAARCLDLGAAQFCQASTEEMASVEMTEANVLALFEAKVEFVIELQHNEMPPTFVELKPHRLNATVGVAWFVPRYFKYPKPRYDVEFRWHGASKSDAREYKTNLTEPQFEHLSEHADVSRVYSIHGLTLKFLEAFNLRLITKDRFIFAVPRK